MNRLLLVLTGSDQHRTQVKGRPTQTSHPIIVSLVSAPPHIYSHSSVLRGLDLFSDNKGEEGEEGGGGGGETKYG